MDKPFSLVPSVMQAPRTVAMMGRRSVGSSNNNSSSLLLETNWIWYKFDNHDRLLRHSTLLELNKVASLPEQGNYYDRP